MLKFCQEQIKPDQSYAQIVDYLEWTRMNIPPIIDAHCQEVIERGFAYVHGRDKYFRPCFVLRAIVLEELTIPKTEMVDAIIKAVSIEAEYIMKNCLIPG